MNPAALAALDAICRRSTGRDLDACPPVMAPAADIAAQVFAVLRDLGPEEADGPTALDAAAEGRAAEAFALAAAAGTWQPLAAVPAATRDTLRAYGRLVVVAIQLMADRGLDYGPIPAGLPPRDRGFAALAIEILQSRSPQRLLDRQRRQAH